MDLSQPNWTGSEGCREPVTNCMSITRRHSLWVLALLGMAGQVCAQSDQPAPRFLKDCDTCPELVRIGPGRFQMGSALDENIPDRVPEQRLTEERPRHPVRIDYEFAMGRYEITIAEFARFADATDFNAPGCFGLTGSKWEFLADADWRSPGFEVNDAYPATCLSYDDFAAYLQWLSEITGEVYRFPTEAEWEYVARIGLGDPPEEYYLGVSACQHQNGADDQFKNSFVADWAPGLFECDDGFAAGSPVGSYEPNALGMYDVFGNVSEWTQDCSGFNHEGAPSDGSAHLRDPCPARVLKGGSWAGGPGFLRPAIRGGFPVPLHGDGHGLRVVREVR
jgi:formylglycine-generating enzyme required for sulfatase activity